MAQERIVAVSGPNGQIGRTLCRELARLPQLHVVALCRNSLSAAMLSATGCESKICNPSSPDSIRDALPHADTVVHCAYAATDPRGALKANTAMIRALGNVNGLSALVNLSSIAVYGTILDSSRSTFKHPKPTDFYGKTKLLCEREASRVGSEKPVNVYNLRLGHVYGPQTGWSAEFFRLANDQMLPLPFEGGLASNCLSTETLVRTIQDVLAGGIQAGTYNVSDAPQRTWLEIFTAHCRRNNPNGYPSLDQKDSARARAHALKTADGDMSPIRHPWRAFGHVVYRGALTPAGTGLARNLLQRAPEPIIARARVHLLRARAQAALTADRPPAIPPVLLCDPMPGPYLSPSPDFNLPESGLDAWLDSIMEIRRPTEPNPAATYRTFAKEGV